MTEKAAKILIVDDNEDLRFNLISLLESEGFKTYEASNGVDALNELKSKKPNLVLLDMKLPGMDGMKILEEIKKIDNDIVVIMLTAYGDIKTAVKAMRSGVYDYITKPFDNEEIALTIRKALETQSLSKEVVVLRKKLEEKHYSEAVLGESEQIKHVLKQVSVIAPTNMTVVIQGESGTGKEVIARMIHRESPRKDNPFIAIDCGAIPENLVESELFGHEKGAFTGAISQKEGKFELASGGTIFLDEITNLSDANQIKLLRVIQERKVHRLGGKKDVEIDVRIIAASNVKLEDAVADGKFRHDLFYRLNEFQLKLPSLRERKEDIPIFSQHFLDDANREMSKEIKGFTSEAMKVFLQYDWPGNVRELKNSVRRAVVVAEDKQIIPENISFTIIQDKENHANSTSSKSNGISTLEDATKEFEKGLIKKTLVQTGGNKIKAAKLLQMNRKTLYRKMKILGLSRSDVS
jgi:DNA-binding NtrC family response regulator